MSDTHPSPQRILVGICSARRYPERRKTIRSTWLATSTTGIEPVFYVGRGEDLQDEPDTLVLDTEDYYEATSTKFGLFLKHVLATREFDWLFHCHDDTYVALDRLHGLADTSFDFIADDRWGRHSLPSGGAGYLISRRLVEHLAESMATGHDRPLDEIVGDAVVSGGFPHLASSRLFRGPHRRPTPYNNFISCHWCSVERMDATHLLLREETTPIQVIHPGWKDRLHLHASGYFMRQATTCCGRWKRSDSGNIHLEWFDWPEEVLVPEPRPNSAKEDIPTYLCLKTQVKTITVRLVGGLGNQMFHYAHGFALAKRLNASLRLEWGGGRRQYGLSLFGLELDSEPQAGEFIEDHDSYKENQIWPTFRRILDLKADHVTTYGLFQNENYFAPYQDQIRGIFSLSPLKPVEFRGKTHVCVHVRRGDYLSSRAHNLCEPSYYLRGMQIMRSLVENPMFIVVSDDPGWCEEFFADAPQTVVLPSQSREDALRTMVGCEAFIIPNSTFSWWGAWLSGSRHVIAPRRFLAHRPWDICPPHWILIPPDAG